MVCATAAIRAHCGGYTELGDDERKLAKRRQQETGAILNEIDSLQG